MSKSHSANIFFQDRYMSSYLKTDALPRVSAVSILAARIAVAFLTLDTHISSLANALVRKS
jgi:hypothetical protein